ncbi:MAG TPA: Ger(x)C family spore germination protein [Clostridia bacterium]|nr:Ger(x)C family spore germination protein [Clostridia bacterium]
MNRNRLILIFGYFLLNLVFGTGCWDSRELDELAIISGIGVDKEGDKFNLSFQIINPTGLKGGEGGGNQGSGGGGTETFVVAQSTGRTIFDAVENVRNQIERIPFFSHNEVIVLGRQLAEEGIYPGVDFFLRSPQPRPTQWVLIGSEKAGDILRPKAEMEDTSARALKLLVDFGRQSWVPAINLEEVNAAMTQKRGAYLIPIVRVQGDKGKLFLDGSAAVMKRDKMVGEVNPGESRGLKWMKGEIRNAVVVSELPNQQGLVSTRIFLNRGSIKVNLTPEGIPRVNVYVYVEGEIEDMSGKFNLTSTPGMDLVKKQVALAIKKEIQSAFQKARSLNADFINIGRILYQNHPQVWEDMEHKWDEIFPEIRAHVTVGVSIWRVGEVSKPAISE